jgi:hypothetical protein
MHHYVTDSDERILVPFYLAFLSLPIAWGLHIFFQTIDNPFAWMLDVPSFGGLYLLFHNWFDKNLWKLPILRKIGLIKVPYIAGKWDGHILSSFDGHETSIKAAIEIKQTWTQLQVTLETENSVSRSETASILTKIPDCSMLSYEYVNEPKPHAISSMQMHRGTARHEYQLDNKHELLDGGYYTGRGRATFGTLYFKRRLRS